ncbi:hypothetical protein DPSP01_009450 [Paraphaeosphaeria sporulosa]
MANKIENPVVIIIGAGISGLLLAQYLTLAKIPFRIFERRENLGTTNEGWGLTLTWSLPTLRDLLPASLWHRLPEAYVDRAAVERGEASTFPFFDLSTGELKGKTPPAPASRRIRVNREKFRNLLATGIAIEWGKTLSSYESAKDGVTVFFKDGSECSGSLLVGCDGTHSEVRSQLLPDANENYIPIRLMGTKLHMSPIEIEPLRNLDSFFLQATSSKNDTFVYFSVLDAPGNGSSRSYVAQIVVSWPYRKGFLNRDSPLAMPSSNAARLDLLKTFAETWAEPFRSLAFNLPDTAELKPLDLTDWPPAKDVHGNGRAMLVGDALHPMAMYRGDGANHSIQDIQEIAQTIAPLLSGTISESTLRAAIDNYEDEVIARCRPAVLASRQAAFDAHDYRRINPQSPLLSPRVMMIKFDEHDEV